MQTSLSCIVCAWGTMQGTDGEVG